MAGRLSNSWDMIKASATVLRSDKELLFFPVFSSIAVIAVTISFAVPVFLLGETSPRPERGLGMFNLPALFIYYFVIYFIIIFMNSALVSAAAIRLKGGNPTIADGFRIAGQNISAILGYALISSTVGLLLKWTQERLGLLGKIFTFLADFAWNLITFLVIPILVNEGIGPVEAVKRSAALLKKTWGEQLIGNIGIGLFFGLLTISSAAVFILLAVISASQGYSALALLFAALFILSALVLAVIGSTLHSIYTAALYRYAAEGIVSANFSERMLRDSFRQK